MNALRKAISHDNCRKYTKALIPDMLKFERDLRKEEDFRGRETDEKYISDVALSFDDHLFANYASLHNVWERQARRQDRRRPHSVAF